MEKVCAKTFEALSVRISCWVDQSIRLNVVSQTLPPGRGILTLKVKAVRSAEQNFLGGGLGFFLQISGIYQNHNRFSQNCFSINSFLSFSLGPEKAFLKGVDKLSSNLCLHNKYEETQKAEALGPQ